jgi:hypothetical protein
MLKLDIKDVKVNGESLTPEMRKKLLVAWETATVSRGKRKGKLKAKCPPMNTLGAACWQGMNTNPWKIGIAHLLFMDKEKMEVYEWYEAIKKRAEAVHSANQLKH